MEMCFSEAGEEEDVSKGRGGGGVDTKKTRHHVMTSHPGSQWGRLRSFNGRISHHHSTAVH